MPSINFPWSMHEVRIRSNKWKFLPYSNMDYANTLKRAMEIIDGRIKGHQPCNAAFKALPGGKTFAEIWNDCCTWISYDPENRAGKYGASQRSSKNITISKYALRMGRWTVAATLVHELAHINGAPSTDKQAEDTLKHCMLKGLHDPTIIGKITEGSKQHAMYA